MYIVRLPSTVHVLLDFLRDALRHLVVNLEGVAPGHEPAKTQPLGGPRTFGINYRTDPAVTRGRALSHTIAVFDHLEKGAVVAAALVKLRDGAEEEGKNKGRWGGYGRGIVSLAEGIYGMAVADAEGVGDFAFLP